MLTTQLAAHKLTLKSSQALCWVLGMIFSVYHGPQEPHDRRPHLEVGN
jgi:hypothetical protein